MYPSTTIVATEAVQYCLRQRAFNQCRNANQRLDLDAVFVVGKLQSEMLMQAFTVLGQKNGREGRVGWHITKICITPPFSFTCCIKTTRAPAGRTDRHTDRH